MAVNSLLSLVLVSSLIFSFPLLAKKSYAQLNAKETASGYINGMPGTLSYAKGKVLEKAHNVKDAFEDARDTLAESIPETVSDAKEKVIDRAQSVKEAIGEAKESATEKAVSGKENILDKAHDFKDAVEDTSAHIPETLKLNATSSNDCIYRVYTKTGTKIGSGTDSKVSLQMYDTYGNNVEIPNLGESGIMGPGHNYFENGNLDISSSLGKCLAGCVCGINLTSDGNRPFPGWYVEFVQVEVTGQNEPCALVLFTIEQWLESHAPAVTKNLCAN